MSKFKVDDLVHIKVPEAVCGGKILPTRGRVVGVFPGGARVIDWAEQCSYEKWIIGDTYLSRALLSDFFKEGDYLLASRSIVVDLGDEQKSKSLSYVRIKIDHFSADGTRAYSVSSDGVRAVVIDMHDRNPWFIVPGSVEDWEEKFL